MDKELTAHVTEDSIKTKAAKLTKAPKQRAEELKKAKIAAAVSKAKANAKAKKLAEQAQTESNSENSEQKNDAKANEGFSIRNKKSSYRSSCR